jgi:hypothetical protein
VTHLIHINIANFDMICRAYLFNTDMTDTGGKTVITALAFEMVAASRLCHLWRR